MKKRIVGKLLAVVLGATMVASAFTGCGKKKGGDGVGADGVVTINLTRACFNVNPDEAQTKKVEDAINDYIASKDLKVKINLKDISSGEYQEKVNLSIQAQEINLLWTASWEQVIGTNDLVPMEAVYDITDLLPGTALYNSMDAGQWEATKYDGKNYFIPVYKDNVEGYDFMIRKDLADKYGWKFDNVKTLKDLEPMLEDIKDEVKYPYLTQKTAMFFRWYLDKFDFFTQLAIVAVDRDKNEVVNPIQSAEYKEFCTLMAEWHEKGYLSSDDLTKTTTDTTTQTKDWGISWWTDVPNNAEANGRYNQEVIMVPATQRWAHSTSALGSCYAIMANSSEAQAKACIDFMGLLFTDSKLADIYTYGIEGEDFSYDENGQVAKSASGLYNHSMWESASATIVTPEAGAPSNTAELYKAFNGGANTSCAAGFRFDKEPVKSAYAACSEVYDTYGFGLEHGGVAASEVADQIATYQKALDDAGYQDVLAEFQKQYNEWKK